MSNIDIPSGRVESALATSRMVTSESPDNCCSNCGLELCSDGLSWEVKDINCWTSMVWSSVRWSAARHALSTSGGGTR